MAPQRFKDFKLQKSDALLLSKLPEEQRICLLLRHREKRTYSQIAAARNFTIGVAASHIYKARGAILRGRIRRHVHDAVEKPLARATGYLTTLLYALPTLAGKAKMADHSKAIMKDLLKALPPEANARDELIALGAVVVGVINAAEIEQRAGLAQHFCGLVLKNVAKELN